MHLNRHALRQQFRTRRQSISIEQQRIASDAIANAILQTAYFKDSEYIAGYIATQGEIDLTPVFQAAWRLGKKCYLPVIQPGKELIFVEYAPDDTLKSNRFNLLEPELNTEKIISAHKLDLVLVPLVAFDTQGNRLGMGGGYYDFTFTFLHSVVRPAKPLLTGCAYEWQCCEIITPEEWDVRLDAIFTEKNIYGI